MIIDEVDYDSTTLVGHSDIFSMMAKPKQAGSDAHTDAHTSKNTGHVLSSKKAGGVMNTRERKCSGAKDKK